MIVRLLLLLALLNTATPAIAEEISTDNSSETRTPVAPDETHPIYSKKAHWTGPMLIVIVGLFLAALVIGPIVRAEAPQSVPEAMSHEEDPAADRH